MTDENFRHSRCPSVVSALLKMGFQRISGHANSATRWRHPDHPEWRLTANNVQEYWRVSGPPRVEDVRFRDPEAAAVYLLTSA